MGDGARRRRALGQHFLVDGAMADLAVSAACLAPGTRVLEIGPGRAALTDALLRAEAEVVAVEIDPELATRLARRVLPSGAGSLAVIHADFLELDFSRLPSSPMTVVANLPYSTGTAILARLLALPERFPRIVVMLQLEVADRLSAAPGSRTYGALSVLTALHAEVARIALVPPEAFAPRPAVQSAIIRLDVSPVPRAPVDDAARFRRVVRAAFAQRRKTLRNALGSAFGPERAQRWLDASGIDAGRRAETLSLEEFAALAASAGADPSGAGQDEASALLDGTCRG